MTCTSLTRGKRAEHPNRRQHRENNRNPHQLTARTTEQPTSHTSTFCQRLDAWCVPTSTHPLSAIRRSVDEKWDSTAYVRRYRAAAPVGSANVVARVGSGSAINSAR